MYSEIIQIIQGALSKDKEKVVSYASLLANNLDKKGEKDLSKRILQILNEKNINPVYLDEFLSTPVDQESRMTMVDIHFPETEKIEVILPKYTELKVKDFINVLENRKEFRKLKLDITSSLLLYGPPGCGKSTLVKYISQKTGLPLVIARLDSVVSSLLGSTAKNIRKIFDYVQSKPCILFLDEIDAIAKARDDQHELGELKRVINSLLQNIDEFTTDNILIAATNHHELLDRAVWRRFNNVIEIPKPTEEEIKKLIQLYTNEVENDFLHDKRKMKKFCKLLNGSSPSDIKNVCQNAISKMVLNKADRLDYDNLIFQTYLFKNHNINNTQEVIQHLLEQGVSQQTISHLMNMSIRQVRKPITKNNGTKKLTN